jgi:hypothetical protein
MQKVERSNPFSRFREGLHLQAFFIRAVGGCVCVAGHPLGTRRRRPRRRASKAVNFAFFAGSLLVTRSLIFCATGATPMTSRRRQMVAPRGVGYMRSPTDRGFPTRHVSGMRQVLLPVLGAMFVIAVLSAVLADCTAGGDGSRQPSGPTSQQDP